MKVNYLLKSDERAGLSQWSAHDDTRHIQTWKAQLVLADDDATIQGAASRFQNIVILGAPRSGTTVLKRYLASNAGCRGTPFVHDVREISLCGNPLMAIWKRTRWFCPDILPRVLEAFGARAYFVLIGRYPLFSFRSLINLNATRGYPTHEWVPIATFEAYLKWWSEIYCSALGALPSDRFSLVSYEQLVVSPVATRRAILQNVGLRGDDDVSYDNSNPTIEDEKCLSRRTIHIDSLLSEPLQVDSSSAYDEVFGPGASHVSHH